MALRAEARTRVWRLGVAFIYAKAFDRKDGAKVGERMLDATGSNDRGPKDDSL